MERKRLFAVGVDGSPSREEVPPDVVWVPAGSDGGAFVFGLKQRSEDDPERALHLALTFLDSRHRACVKYLTVEAEGSKTTLDWANEIALELKRLEPGDISVTPDLAKIYARRFIFEEDEDEKGPLHLLRGDRRRPKRTRGLTARFGRMIGRKTELDRLEELVQQTQEDQGQVVALTGAPGIGKTRLKMALEELLAKKGIETYEGAYQFRKTEPYQAFRQMVRALLERRGTKLDTLGLTIAEFDYLELLTNPEKIPENLKGLSDEDLKKGLFFAVRKLIHHAAKSLLLLIFEDLHWADDGSIELLEYVMEEMEKTKLLLLLVHRPEVKQPWAKRLNYTEIEIQPFNSPELELFVKDVSSVDRVPQPVVKMVESVSLGNPLFIEEMLRHLLDSKALEVQTLENEEKLLGGKSPKLSDIPSTLHSLIASRFDRLPEKTKEALRWAAILGVSFDHGEYVDLLKENLSVDPTEEIERLMERRYLFEKWVFPTKEMQFTHDLIHAVVLENIPGIEAKRLHRTAGGFLKRRHPSPGFEILTRIAEHHLQGDDAERAIETAIKAGETALNLFRLSQAEHFLMEALKRWKEVPVKEISPHVIYLPLVKTLLETANLDTTESFLEEWKQHDVESNLEVWAEYWTLLMRLRQAQFRHEEAVSASDEALKALDKLGDRSERRYRVVEGRLYELYSVARRRDAIAEGRRAIDELGNKFPEIRLGIWGILAILSAHDGAREETLDCLRRGEELITLSMPPSVRVQHRRRAAGTYEYLRMTDEERRSYDDALALAREAGLRGMYVHALSARGASANDWGDFISSFRDLEEALVEARRIKSRGVAEYSFFCLVDNLHDMGDFRTAKQKWEEFKLEFPEPVDLRQKGRRFNLEATSAEALGDFAAAAKLRSEAAKILRDLGDLVFYGRAKFQLLRVEAKGGLRPIESIVFDFNCIAAEVKKVEGPILDYARRETAYLLAAFGGRPIPPPEINYDSLTCTISYYLQNLSVAKIQWFDSIGKFKEADELRTKYRAVREKMKEKIPPQYHKTFDNHPLYRVPERKSC